MTSAAVDSGNSARASSGQLDRTGPGVTRALRAAVALWVTSVGGCLGPGLDSEAAFYQVVDRGDKISQPSKAIIVMSPHKRWVMTPLL